MSNTKNQTAMNTTVQLSEQEISEQKQYAQKYYDLIQKELGYGDLCNLENLATYNKSYKHHSTLAKTGVVTL